MSLTGLQLDFLSSVASPLPCLLVFALTVGHLQEAADVLIILSIHFL